MCQAVALKMQYNALLSSLLMVITVGQAVTAHGSLGPKARRTCSSCCSMLPQELWDAIADLAASGTDQVLLDGLARGIGVHHSGLDTRYRQVVEMLSRSKHLQVGAALAGGWPGQQAGATAASMNHHGQEKFV